MNLYRKTYLCICEGQQEKLYLKRIAALLKKWPERVVTFNTMLDNPERLKKTYTEYDNAALFDYDFNEDVFSNNIEICDRLKKTNNSLKRKSSKNIYHAYSNVNFDLWLILHKEDYNKSVSKNDAYVANVKRIYGLTPKENIKCKSVIDKILAQISLNDVKKAIERANLIRERKLDSDKVLIGSSICYPNPDFSIHEFLKAVLVDCGEM